MPKKIEQIKLRVFEAFAGIGAQASALKRMKIDYEIVGISEWFIDAIECYAAIHCKDIKVCVSKYDQWVQNLWREIVHRANIAR